MLVLDFQAGQVEAFVEIHHRYAGLTRHVCGRFLKNHQDVDEALQETWIRIFQGLHRFNGRYELQAWVSRIATNVSLDLLRTRARRPKLDDQPIHEHEREDVTDGPEEQVEKLVQRDMVIAVLAGLPDTHRRALVLRELEGRSHKEIGVELEMSPAQAKALIHRAKGTFRREWLRAATERHGLVGIFLIPVFWLSKLGGVARRIADSAGEAAHVGGARVLTQVAEAASAPLVPAAASGVGEKIIAAGLTLLVAGGVTVGAATIAGDRAARDKPEAVAAAPVAVPTSDPTPSEPAQADDAEGQQQKGAHHGGPTKDNAGEVAVPPVPDEPVPTPSAEPSASPSTEPTPDPTPSQEPTPVVPPAPAWSFTFTSSNESVETCDCDPAPRLVSSSLEGEVGGEVTFAQTVEGAAVDVVGDPTWPFVLQLSGAAGPSGGRIDYGFTLSSAGGLYSYEGGAVLAEAGANSEDGSHFYRFYGTYQLVPGPDPVAGIPQRGFLRATLAIWPDGTIYLGSVALSEAT
jgi:RNA polymerase sigma-70 factor (ECF subfamily)